MKTALTILVAVLAVASANPVNRGKENDVDSDFMKRVEAQFKHWHTMNERALIYPDGWNEPLCSDENCCNNDPYPCTNGTCNDEDGNDNPVSIFGYICEGDACGVESGQNAGVLCNVPADEACDICFEDYGAEYCQTSTFTFSGSLCYDTVDGDTIVYGKRELDILYGQGASDAMTDIITKEHFGKKRSLQELLRELEKALE